MAKITSKQLGELKRGRKKNPRGYKARATVDEATSPINFRVCAKKLVTKPRIVRSDAWKQRPRIEEWYVWKDLVSSAYRTYGGKTFRKPVKITYWFFVQQGRKLDNDNLIKGINDSLNGLAFLDDNIKRLRHIGGSFVYYIPKGQEEVAYVRIEPLTEEEADKCSRPF